MHSKLQVKDKTELNKGFKADTFRKNIRKTTAHKHNSYFELVYLSKGKGTHTIDSQTYRVDVPVLFVIRKEQVHFWDLENEPDGYVLILKKSFIEESLDKELRKLLLQVSRFACIQLLEQQQIELLLELLVQEYNAEAGTDKNVVEGLMKALLAKVVQQINASAVSKNTGTDLYQQFRELLSQEQVLQNSVAHYAQQLNTTPQNLNAACRKIANQPAAEVLSEFIIEEAKRLLLYTDNTIAEIAYAFEFSDSSHFVKYFKRHTGYTPKVFRLLA